MRVYPDPAENDRRLIRRFGVALIAALVATTPSRAAASAVPALCIMPPVVPFEKDDPRTTGLEERVVHRLENAGFQIRSSREVEPLVKTVVADRPFFDPATGEFDRTRWTEREQELGRALHDQLGCDARLRIGLRRLMATNSGGSATWDGHSIPIATSAYAVLSGNQISHVAALSLWIDLTDLAGTSLAYRSAGVEPLIQLSLSRSIDRLPEDRWLRDEAAVDRALDSALGPMAIDLRHRGQAITQRHEFPFPWPERR